MSSVITASSNTLEDFTDVCGKELTKKDFHSVYDYISPLSAHWKSIAIAWRLDIDTINRLDTGNATWTLQKVLEHWLKQDYDCKINGVPCWRMVCVAVRKGGKDSALADKIAKEHPLERSKDVEQQEKCNPQLIPDRHHEIVEIGTITYFRSKKLGDGASGTTVYKGQYDGQDIAVKVVKENMIKDGEIKILQQCAGHENIVKYYCNERDVEYYYLALQLCLTSLQDYIENKEILKEFTIDKKEILGDAMRGLNHLHKQRIIHRDVKPSNILLVKRNSKIRAVIADFGISTALAPGRYSKTTSGFKGTYPWTSPEWANCEEDTKPQPKVSNTTDIFSMGCVMYYVLSDGQHPFGKGTLTILKRLDAYSFKLDGISNGVEDRETAKHLIVQMIKKDEDLR